ncbi:MAG: T9SS type A sorting domain-containing protein [Chitinophagales bacterium]|nr:T9SS type A sorting domain-containing protein [Chitinophagales bacterium]
MISFPAFSQCTLTKETCTLTYSTETLTSTITGDEWDGEKVCLQENLVVDDDFSINLSEVYISNDISIIVESPNTLTITNSELFANDEMWENIYVESGASLNITGSVIADAYIGIFAENNTSESFLNLYGNHFCNNEIGIYIGTYSAITGLTTFILNNEFSAPSLIAPKTGEIGDYGIFIDKVNATGSGPGIFIGNAIPFTGSTTYNYFHNINIGIRAFESKVTIQNNLFVNFTSGSGASLPDVFPINENHNFRNTAIVASSNTVKLSQLTVGTSFISGYYNNEIRNSGIGIQANTYVQPTIISNNISGNVTGSTYTMRNGISIENYSDEILVTNNRIEKFSDFGIMQTNQLQTSSVIADNIISTVNGFTTSMVPIGIGVSESTGGTNLIQTIENNIISDIRTGIWVVNTAKLQAVGNIVDFESTGATLMSFGLKIKNCPEAFIQSNIVTGDCTSGSCGGLVRNIYLEGCEFALVDQNYTQYGTAGLWFQSSSIYSNFTCNEIRDCFRGVVWFNILGGITDPPIGPAIQSSTGGPSDNAWFPATTQNRLHVQATTDASAVKWRYRDDFDYFDFEYDPSLIIEGIDPTELPDPVIVPGETCDMPLRTTDDDEDPITVLENKYALWITFYLSDAEYSPLTYYKSWRFWNEIKNDAELIALFSDDLELVYEKLLTTNIPDLQNINTLIANKELESAEELNNGLVPDNVIETALQTVNSIYLSKVDTNGNLNLTSENIAELEEIAQADGAVNGYAVYLAQGMLQKSYEMNIDFPEEKKYQQVDNTKLLFYPNPTTNYLYLNTNLLSKIHSIHIFDFTGKEVFKTNQFESGYILFNDIATGIYLTQIRMLDGTSQSDIISIISNK